MKEAKRIKMNKLLIISHRDEKYNIGSMVNNTIITSYGENKWNYTYCGEHFMVHIIVQSLLYT